MWPAVLSGLVVMAVALMGVPARASTLRGMKRPIDAQA